MKGNFKLVLQNASSEMIFPVEKMDVDPGEGIKRQVVRLRTDRSVVYNQYNGKPEMIKDRTSLNGSILHFFWETLLDQGLSGDLIMILMDGDEKIKVDLTDFASEIKRQLVKMIESCAKIRIGDPFEDKK